MLQAVVSVHKRELTNENVFLLYNNLATDGCYQKISLQSEKKIIVQTSG